MPYFIKRKENLLDPEEVLLDKKAKESAEKEKLDSLVGSKKSIDFNEKEAKIWKRKPGTSEASNNIKDYHQAIKEEDFLERYINIERSDELKKAEQEIENEIKRFERKLGKIVSKEDLVKLKKYRLINNLISIRELESPEKLFKSSEEIRASLAMPLDTGDEDQDTKSQEPKQEISKKVVPGISIKDIGYFAEKVNQIKNSGDEEEYKKELKKLQSMVRTFVLEDPEAEEKLLDLKELFSKIGFSFRREF